MRFDWAFRTHGRQPGCFLENACEVFPEHFSADVCSWCSGYRQKLYTTIHGKFDAFLDGEGKWVLSPWYRLLKAAAYHVLKKRGICVYSSSKSLVLETSVFFGDGMWKERCWKWPEHLNHIDSSVFPQLCLSGWWPRCRLRGALFPVHPSPCYQWRAHATQLFSLLRLMRYCWVNLHFFLFNI